MDTGIAPKNTSHTKAARCGEPSYVWRAGQDRRLGMILQAANKRISRIVLENGCGVGMYAEHLAGYGGTIIGLEYDFERAVEAHHRADEITNAAGERLPFDDQTFDLILSHEVLEHVQDDQMAVREMVRVLQPGGRIALFVPNRGYPFETHGVFWRDHYRFGNIPLVNFTRSACPTCADIHMARSSALIWRIASQVYFPHGHIRSIRQYHCEAREGWKIAEGDSIDIGEDTIKSVWAFSFLGNRKNQIKLGGERIAISTTNSAFAYKIHEQRFG